jgi:HAD superfamily hydrolase (TIGR01549 family)
MTKTQDLEIQEHWHRHYRMQIVRHYELLMDHLRMNVDPYELLKLNFETISGMHHTMEAETLDVFRDLSRTYKNVLATNCVTEIKGRLSVFEPYCYRIFLSDEIHAIKPTATFFHVVLKSLECRPEECMMIGDSAVDDMAGGKRAGLYTCWYRPGTNPKTCSDADFQIQSITELPLLLEDINGQSASHAE